MKETEKRDDTRFEESIRFVARHYEEGRFEPEQAWRRFSSERAIPRVAFLRRVHWTAVAAALVLLLGFGATWWWRQGQPDWVSVSAGANRLAVVYLPDSSKVTLASGATLRYDARHFGASAREVILGGKAFFEVQPNPEAPFTAYVGNVAARVLGTTFQLEELAGGVRLDVRTGRVRFSSRAVDRPVVLTAGMSATYEAALDSIRLLPETVEENHFSWETRTLRFRETPLEVVIQDIADCYQVRIENQLPKPGARLTSTFESVPLRELLEIINETLGVRLVVVGE